MAEDSIDLQALVHRLVKVENQNARRKLFVITIPLIVLISGFTITASSPSKVVVAEKISIVDKNGTTRLKMESENGTPQITLAYENGDPCLRISGEEMCFYDQKKKARINILAKNGLDSSCLSITDREGKSRLTLSAGPDGPYISIDDTEEKKEVIISIEPIGTLNSIEYIIGKGFLMKNDDHD